MMAAEFEASHYRRAHKGWFITAVVGTIVSAYSIREGINYGESFDNQQYRELSSRVYGLENQLFKDGTLGSDGGLLVRYLEVRNPTDPRILEWGRMKNQLDEERAKRQKHYESSWGDFLKRMGIFGGPALTLFSLTNMRWARRKALGIHN